MVAKQDMTPEIEVFEKRPTENRKMYLKHYKQQFLFQVLNPV